MTLEWTEDRKQVSSASHRGKDNEEDVSPQVSQTQETVAWEEEICGLAGAREAHTPTLTARRPCSWSLTSVLRTACKLATCCTTPKDLGWPSEDRNVPLQF